MTYCIVADDGSQCPEYHLPCEATADQERSEWRALALRALHDLRCLGVDITLLDGVDERVLAEVEHYGREMEAYS